MREWHESWPIMRWIGTWSPRSQIWGWLLVFLLALPQYGLGGININLWFRVQHVGLSHPELIATVGLRQSMFGLSWPQWWFLVWACDSSGPNENETQIFLIMVGRREFSSFDGWFLDMRPRMIISLLLRRTMIWGQTSKWRRVVTQGNGAEPWPNCMWSAFSVAGYIIISEYSLPVPLRIIFIHPIDISLCHATYFVSWQKHVIFEKKL